MSAPYKHTDVTADELKLMAVHHRKSEYTNAEQLEVLHLVRKYVNAHIQSCLTCSNNLREVKNALNAFYLRWKDEIETRLNPPAQPEEITAPTALEIAKKETKEYVKPKKNKKK